MYASEILNLFTLTNEYISFQHFPYFSFNFMVFLHWNNFLIGLELLSRNRRTKVITTSFIRLIKSRIITEFILSLSFYNLHGMFLNILHREDTYSVKKISPFQIYSQVWNLDIVERNVNLIAFTFLCRYYIMILLIWFKLYIYRICLPFLT